MKIGIDAKRIFYNGTGLGVYGRNLVQGLQAIDKKNYYLLFSPKLSDSYFKKKQLPSNFSTINAGKSLSYVWRTFSIINDIKNQNLDIYHGLSNELPFYINKANCKSIVDIHDLCFVNFKQGYSRMDQQIYWHKAKRAALQSDKIIATSEATKKDILQYLDVPENKIEVVYQCCDSSFYQEFEHSQIEKIRVKFSLPHKFILTVGTIQERKNQKAIIQALALIPKTQRLPLVLVGNGGKYLNELIALANSKNIAIQVLNNVDFQDLPIIYHAASLFIYPSFVEGFGIPVLEAMASKIPVITSKKTSMAEIIQDEDALINPHNITEISEKILYFLNKNMEQKTAHNYNRSLDFSPTKFAGDVLKIYEAL